MRPTPNQMIAEAKVVHNGMIMKLFASWRALLLTYCEIITKYQITFLFYFWVCSILEPSPWSLWSETLFSHRSVCACFLPGAANHQSQTTLRPPLPPPHNHHTLSHQSANSLNRNTLRGGRNPIHAPAPGTGDGPTTPESVQLQDSWVLNSNVPLETRSEYIFSVLFWIVFLLTGLPDADIWSHLQ